MEWINGAFYIISERFELCTLSHFKLRKGGREGKKLKKSCEVKGQAKAKKKKVRANKTK